MGLDITVYENLKIVKDPQLDENGVILNWKTEWQPGSGMEWSEKYFPGRGEGISPKSVYTWENSMDFRAGSYSSYNLWRDELEQFARSQVDKNLFIELIDFADNEGVIGPIVSKKLLKDFAKSEKQLLNLRIH